VSRSATASTVASSRGSSGGRNPTIAIIRLEASKSSDPTYWVNALASSLQPWSSTKAWMSSRTADQVATRSRAPSTSASAIARSRATQHITFE
jgi:hypothetical protein